MAGNTQGDNSGNILVEFDYNNIIMVDPNKTIDAFGNIRERLVDHEKLVMFANLEAEVIPRTKLSVGGSPEDRIRTLSVAKMNFLRPTEGTFLTDGYYDELTGKNAKNQLGQNQMREELINPQNGTAPYIKTSVNNPGQIATDNGLLGITSINVKTNTSFIPSVTMQLEDIQGKALFQLGNNSPYSAFFNLPYCPFYLTLKGYYGQAVRYQLNLTKFNARFNTFSGNYQIDLEFVGYKFNILNEISLGHLFAAPHMYSTRFDISKSITSPEGGNKNIETQTKQLNGASKQSTISNSNVVEQIVSERGYQKVVELYSEYKAKGLVKPDFPEITLAQLMNKFENFEKNIVNSYTKVDVEPLTNVRVYLKTLTNYFNTIRGSKDSWFNTYLNPKPIILKSGEKVYGFKQNVLDDPTIREPAKSLLSGYTIEYNKLLATNPTLGVGGQAEIKNSINYDTMIKSIGLTDIDLYKTTIQQTGIIAPTTADTTTIQTYISKLLAVNIEKSLTDTTNSFGIQLIPSLFIFEGVGNVNGQIPRFDYLISQLDTQANKKLSEFETAISADFLRKIEDSSTGIGFRPTVRNVCAVIMASAEAFIRLLDDVHTNAWDVKYDPVRKAAILENPSSAPGVDTLQHVKVDPKALANNSNLANSQIPVYPWPQFFVETPEDKKGRFQLKYIADPTVVDITQGWNYAKWPEVEFVEEYMKGLTQKFNPPLSQPPTDSEATTNIININAIEYPSLGIAYANKEEIKFFYEIWERQFLTANYNGFTRATSNQLNQITELIVSAETNNIITSVGISSPFLTLKLKNYDITAQNYVQTLENFSNQGTGQSYQEFIRDFYVTPYIRNITENSFNILEINDLGKQPQTNAKSEALLQLVNNASNDPKIVDTYPFTNPTWVSNNMALSNNSSSTDVYDTKKVLTVFQPRNVISNFDSIYDVTKNRPVTNFCYLKISNPTTEISQIGLNSFYDLRKNAQNFIPTEGFTRYTSPSSVAPKETTTAILNTPYFINAIQNGVDNWRKSDKYPYVQAAYLFINSLPLASLRERYKTDSTIPTNNFVNVSVGASELDYIASCFKKFGAIHKIPFAWVLKIGSIWYRYKTYKTTGVDILDSAWKNFDYKKNFDPITSSDTKTYTFKFDGEKKITLQSDANNLTSIQTGFYPKLINDFSAFYNGYDLYNTYTDSEIQQSIDGGVKVFNFETSNISTPTTSTIGGVGTVKFSQIQTWSVVIPNGVAPTLSTLANNSLACNPNNNTSSSSYYVVPSFGTQFNQVRTECFVAGLPVCSFLNNESIYNGSVRLLWSASNYGYFNGNQTVLPPPDAYVNKINTTSLQQSPFRLLITDEYSKIEEIFSVFDKSILDKFEQQFLNFSKPISDIDLGPQIIVPVGQSPVDGNAQFKNFQLLFRNLMQINAKESSKTNAEYFQNIGDSQLINFSSNIKAFLEYDVMLKYGNPANYKRRIVDSFISDKGGNNAIVDPIIFDPYVANTLPSVGGKISLTQSKTNFPLQWTALETEVGFSTIQNLVYTDNGSYITDFFIDNNIAFTVNNVVLCAPLIKMYATQKLYTPSITTTQFVSRLQSYLDESTTFQNILLNGVLTKVRALLPNQQQLPERTIQSVIDGQQSKVENYEVFKALNDKWISGGDFKTKTLFEDIMFLDRASRNIGDTIIVDIFSLKDMLIGNKSAEESSLNMRMSVFTFMSGILIKNKFNVMPLPAYVNFYNVQDVDGTTIPQTEGSLEFADNMWGTFLNVDYRKASSKMICFYAGKPSSHLALPEGNSRYRDDSFDLRRTSGNPNIEDWAGKKDYALSNRCVGFNVDIGNRNQGVFYSFNVSMDAGKATSETVQTQLNMIDQANGREVATQNVSLYNLYKQRSYTCQVVCLGNALLQPTMYFNLRHVPMFNGPYLITEVNHAITNGSFQTSFSGIRQGVYDLPSIDSLLQSINENVLTKIEAIIKNSKDPVTATPTTDINKTALLQQTGNSVAAAQNSCSESLNKISRYSTWGNFVVSTTTSLNPTELVTEIKNKTTDPSLQLLIYVMCYITNFRENKFYGYNNNYGNIKLTSDWGTGGDFFIQQQSSCVEIKGSSDKLTSQPIANFRTTGDFVSFMVSRLKPRVNQIYGTDGSQPTGAAKFYSCYWQNESMIDVTYYNEHGNEFKTLENTITNAIKSAGDAKIDINAINQAKIAETKEVITGATNNLNTTTTVAVSCPPPTITSFSPLTGASGTILTITGNQLDTVTAVTINNVTVTTGITIISLTSITVIVPLSNTVVIQNNPIIVETTNGSGSSFGSFTYNPNQKTATAPPTIPNTPPNVNTQSQQTGPIVLTGKTTSNLNGSDETLTVGINPAAGNWEIISEWNSWQYKIIKRVLGPNNVIVEEVLDEGTVEQEFRGNVSANKQRFFLDDFGLIAGIKANTGLTDKQIASASVIYNKFEFVASATDKFVKWRTTKNPDDVIDDIYQSFTMLLKFR